MALLLSLIACDETQQIVLGPIMNGVSEDDTLVEADVSYYRDWEFTERLTDTVEVGTTVYTKVAFSRTDVLKDIAVVDLAEVQPDISFVYAEDFYGFEVKSTRYRMVPRSVAYEDMQSGDARSHEVTEGSFVCKYTVQTRDFGETFATSVDNRPAADRQLRVVFFTYLSDEAPEHEINTQGNPQDFIGVVCIPNTEIRPLGDGRFLSTGREVAQPVPDVTVTVMSGPRSGEQTSTDQTGRYVFPNVARDEMRLRIEKDLFEPKEVMVYRDRPTILANGNVPDFTNDLQKKSRHRTDRTSVARRGSVHTASKPCSV